MITRQYQFPRLTERMHDEIVEWYQAHNDGRCANVCHGSIGGDIAFTITPTSIGDFIEVRCSCGATLDFDEV